MSRYAPPYCFSKSPAVVAFSLASPSPVNMERGRPPHQIFLRFLGAPRRPGQARARRVSSAARRAGRVSATACASAARGRARRRPRGPIGSLSVAFLGQSVAAQQLKRPRAGTATAFKSCTASVVDRWRNEASRCANLSKVAHTRSSQSWTKRNKASGL